MGIIYSLYFSEDKVINDLNNKYKNNKDYKEIYFTKNITNMTKSNISLQNSYNKYNINKILDKFIITKKTEGWTSEIFLLKSDNLNLIKKIYNKNIDNNILKENYNNEVNSLILMKSEKHIPNIYDVNFMELTLILEDCGETLNINNCPENWKEQFTEIFYILRKFHIYHNDIHIANFCVKNNIIYIIDFGLAKHHIDWQYQNFSLDVIKESDNINDLFLKIRENGIQIRKCLFCDENLKNI